LKFVTKEQYDNLVESGLINFTKMNRNFQMTGRGKPSRRHKYYVVESRKILEKIKEMEKSKDTRQPLSKK
jgi:hypothetical protein